MPDFTGRDFGRLESKMDAAIDILREMQDAQRLQDKRLRKVEGKIHWYSGAAAAFGALLGAVGIKLSH